MRSGVEFNYFLFELLNLDNPTIKTWLNLSSFKTSHIYVVCSRPAGELGLRDGILKTTKYLRMMGVFDSIELQMLRRADCVPTLFPTQVYVLTAFHGCEHVSPWGAWVLSPHSLLSLAFATRWNKKDQSYVSVRLFLKLSG